MSMECRERYIRQIENILTSKTKHTTGCLIEGEGDVCLEFQKELINALQDNHTLVCHIDFNDYTSETDCIAALKKPVNKLVPISKTERHYFLRLLLLNA